MSHSVGAIQGSHAEAVDVNSTNEPVYTHTITRPELVGITEEALEKYPLDHEANEICRKIAREVDYVLMSDWWSDCDGVGCLMGNLRHLTVPKRDPEPHEDAPSEEERQQFLLGIEFDDLLHGVVEEVDDETSWEEATEYIVKVVDLEPASDSIVTWPPKS